MYQMLIVEDEELELASLEKIVRGNCSAISAVMTAGSGDAALSVLESFTPDLVLMDIHLGNFSGLDLSSLILEENPDAKIIIITAYDQFSYAQQGVKIGIADYLLKPIGTPDLLAAIEKQIAGIEEQKTSVLKNTRLQANFSNMKDVVSCCLTGSIINGLVTPGLSEILVSLHIPYKTMCVFTLSFSLKDIDLTRSEEIVLKKMIVDAVLEDAHDFHLFYDVMNSSHITLCCFYPAGHGQNNIATARDIRHQIITKLHLPVKIGLSETVFALSDLSAAYRHAALALRIGNDSINQYSDYLATGQSPGETEFESGSLVSYIVRNDIPALATYIHDAFSSRSMAGAAFAAIKTDCIRLWLSLAAELSHQVPLKNFDYDREIMQPVLNMLGAGCTTDLAELFVAAAQKIAEIISVAIRNQTNYTTLRAREYIDAHYKEPLTLTVVSDKLNISPYYLSHIFKDEFGVNVIEYLNHTRIRNAKHLLSKSGLAVKDIALKTGFSDPNYFCRIFKKLTGLTPSAYRSLNQ
ncbi:helix-turn-helix domain-containing protein [Christensenella tenuis]|uniref:Stage 0 sporulation protein A homolog n=1 Tax=Christensenella tenuis TaxID=2763033 RepID=A0ABR7EH47_9FIRM|nr:helix-turn-helix domain-containing protein [Christensenella tenuis]MBC5649105.1 helix-turn-helix domain-containing protein [Christensenella tenuis]